MAPDLRGILPGAGMIPALIGAGASLLGGIFGRNSERKAIAQQNAYNDPAAVRERFEAAGFNPLLGIQPGVGIQTAIGGGNFIGSAIADAGRIFGEGMQRRAEMAQLDKLATENNKLSERIANLTIRPRVAGIYASNQGTPRLGAAYRAENGYPNSRSQPSDVADDTGLPPLTESVWVDPRRGVDNADIKSHSGWMMIENRFGNLYVPTLDGDEPLGVDDAPSVAVLLPQIAANFSSVLTDNMVRQPRPNTTRAQGLANQAAYYEGRAKARSEFYKKPHNMRFDPFTASGYVR